MNELTKVEKNLPAARPEVMERIAEVSENLESLEGFRLPRARMTSEGFELIDGEEPITQLEGVVIYTKKTNVFYDKPYDPSKAEAPTCYSLDGVTPDVENPVHKTCKGCPMAEWGTNAKKSGKACRNMKPLFMLLGDEAIMPRQVTVTPINLKAANQYLLDLTERGLAYRKVRTRITAYKENPRDPFMRLKFSMVGKLEEQSQRDVEFLKAKWMAVMNSQSIDQNEIDVESTTVVKESKEF